MNYSDKIKFDHWIKNCPIDNLYVDEPISQIRGKNNKVHYLVKLYLTFDKELWDSSSDSENTEISENIENIEDFEKKQGSVWL